MNESKTIEHASVACHVLLNFYVFLQKSSRKITITTNNLKDLLVDSKQYVNCYKCIKEHFDIGITGTSGYW